MDGDASIEVGRTRGREFSPFFLFGVAWLGVAAQILWLTWPDLAVKLIDPDDAMRLVEVRAYLAGQGWFDLHEARVAPPLGYDSHWSRLVDAGLAGLFRLFALAFEPPMAERLMRAVWPLLWLGFAFAATMAVAQRIAGDRGALAVTFLALLGLPAYPRFIGGNIDHHNVQIALTMVMLATTVWSDRKPRIGGVAGIVAALALAVGLECLPFVVLCGGAFAMRFVFTPAGGRALGYFGSALAVGTVVAFLATVGPDRWGAMVCDSFAINLAAPLALAGAALTLLGAARGPTPAWLRLVSILVIAGAAAGMALGMEPRCLGGPFAMMDPAARAKWLVNVQENLPLLQQAREDPITTAFLASPLLLACVATIVLALTRSARGDFGIQATIVLFVAATLVALSTAKIVSYAIWFSLPLLAAFACLMWKVMGLERALARVAVVGVMSPLVVGLGGIGVASALSTSHESSTDVPCNLIESYRALSELPPGLVFTDVDSGPYVLALTRHSVLGAPYHRLSPAILATFRIFEAPPEAARDELARLGASYVAVCGGRLAPIPPVATSETPQTFARALSSDQGLDWLDRIPDRQSGLKVYRMIPASKPVQLR